MLHVETSATGSNKTTLKDWCRRLSGRHHRSVLDGMKFVKKEGEIWNVQKVKNLPMSVLPISSAEEDKCYFPSPEGRWIYISLWLYWCVFNVWYMYTYPIAMPFGNQRRWRRRVSSPNLVVFAQSSEGMLWQGNELHVLTLLKQTSGLSTSSLSLPVRVIIVFLLRHH